MAASEEGSEVAPEAGAEAGITVFLLYRYVIFLFFHCTVGTCPVFIHSDLNSYYSVTILYRYKPFPI